MRQPIDKIEKLLYKNQVLLMNFCDKERELRIGYNEYSTVKNTVICINNIFHVKTKSSDRLLTDLDLNIREFILYILAHYETKLVSSVYFVDAFEKYVSLQKIIN